MTALRANIMPHNFFEECLTSRTFGMPRDRELTRIDWWHIGCGFGRAATTWLLFDRPQKNRQRAFMLYEPRYDSHAIFCAPLVHQQRRTHAEIVR
jgi:hypothetical protein